MTIAQGLLGTTIVNESTSTSGTIAPVGKRLERLDNTRSFVQPSRVKLFKGSIATPKTLRPYSWLLDQRENNSSSRREVFSVFACYWDTVEKQFGRAA